MFKQFSTKIRSWILLDGLRADRAIRIVWQAAPKWTLISAALIAVQGIVPLVTLYILKLIVDHLSGIDSGSLPEESAHGMVGLIAAALGTTLIGNLTNAALGHANIIQAQLVADRMQQVVQQKSIELDLAYYEDSQSFDRLHRAQREAPSRPVRIVQGLTQVARNLLTMMGAFALLFLFHWSVVVAVFTASLPIVFYRLKQAEAVYKLHRDMTASERLAAYFNRVITTGENAKEVRVFGFGSLISGKFRDLRRISAQGARRQFVTESTATLAGYGALFFIVHAAVDNSITLGQLVLYVGAFQVALGSLRPTLAGMAEVYGNNLFLSALYELLEVPRSVPEPVDRKQVPRPWRAGITVENLSFRYPGTEKLVLDGIDLTIAPGETVAMVGRNGSGKTTLTKLLCRLYDPTVGRITIDGTDLREFGTQDFRQQVSVIYQDFGRYQMTGRDNILLGHPGLNANAPAIVNVARLAGVHDDLMGLPRGYDTVMSRAFVNGEEFSIGQWQKLALARALLRDSQLILLDEPTSSLDAAAEFDFFEKFRSMVRGRSALVISHRFSTVRLADRIYVLDQGRLVEQGDHRALIHLDGLYAHLFRKQASYYTSRG